LFQTKDGHHMEESSATTTSLSDVTLNMLNATSEADVDVEGLGPPSAHF
jgi:hypothetical protein